MHVYVWHSPELTTIIAHQYQVLPHLCHIISGYETALHPLLSPSLPHDVPPLAIIHVNAHDMEGEQRLSYEYLVQEGPTRPVESYSMV